jgi:alpha-tubulin suppressor-like RCC1 family protein
MVKNNFSQAFFGGQQPPKARGITLLTRRRVLPPPRPRPPTPESDTYSESSDTDDQGPPGQEVEAGPAPRGPRAMSFFWQGNGAGMIAAGIAHSVVLNVDGSVNVFGSNEQGQLGLARRGAPSPVKIPTIDHAICVAAGDYHTAVVTAEGKVLTFGMGATGQLGYDPVPSTVQAEPREVPGITNAIGVSCGRNFTMVLLRDGNVVAFGENCDGNQCLLGTANRNPYVINPSPVVNLPPYPVIAVACGDYHSLFLFANGQVAAVGLNLNGELGLEADIEHTPVPVLLPHRDVAYIFAWGGRSAIIFNSGDGMVFGGPGFPARIDDAQSISGNRTAVIVVHRSSGRVSTTTTTRVPFRSQLIDDRFYFRRPVLAVACSNDHTLLKHVDGSVSTFGNGDQGQLGHGPAVYRLRVNPKIVEGGD